jgi:hypothetical protein
MAVGGDVYPRKKLKAVAIASCMHNVLQPETGQ